MSIASSTRVLLVAGAGLALAFAAPAFAQVDETQAASVPSCSASVTDHCIRRGGFFNTQRMVQEYKTKMWS